MKFKWLVSLIVIITMINGQFSFGQILSIETAKNAVMQFERKTINLPKIRLIEVNDKKFYHLLTLTGDEYRVDAQTGEVVGVVYWSISLPDVPQEQPPLDVLPLSKLRSIAQTIAEQRYPQFKTKKMLLYKPYWDGYTFCFQFQEQLPSGALTCNLCLIRLLPDGRLYSYQAGKVTVGQGAYQTPKISPQQAVELSRKAAKLLEVTDIKSQRLVYRGRRLIWVISIFGPSLKGYYSGYAVILDAHSGSIIEVAPYKLIGHAMPPRGYTMIVSHRGVPGILLKRELGPIKHDGMLMIRTEMIRALGGEVLEERSKIILKGDKAVTTENYWRNHKILHFLLNDLRKAFPYTIKEIQFDQKRNTLLIIVNHYKIQSIQQRILSMGLEVKTKDLEREFSLISMNGKQWWLLGLIALISLIVLITLIAFRQLKNTINLLYDKR